MTYQTCERLENLQRALHLAILEARTERERMKALRQRLIQNREHLTATLNTTRRICNQLAVARTTETHPNLSNLAQPPEVTVAAPADLDRLNEGELDTLVSRLTAAYREAVAIDDEQAENLFRIALWRIGVYLAQRLGPRALGLALN